MPTNIIRPTTEAAKESAVDATVYPSLAEEVVGTSVSSPIDGTGMADLGTIVTSKLSQILGWQARPDDPKGFTNALTQSFDLRDVEGHVEFKWRPRSYAVQTDLAGGVTGAQASIYERARAASERVLPLLDGLYSLTNETDPEDLKAIRAVVRDQIDGLVAELGTLGGPMVRRGDLYFEELLGDATLDDAGNPIAADTVGGQLGELRDILGLGSDEDRVNTVDEEANATNFRILADYLLGLRQSWVENRDFFLRGSGQSRRFFGTQLVLLQRQLSVVGDEVRNLRRMLKSVFLDSLERQTLLIEPQWFTKKTTGTFVPRPKKEGAEGIDEHSGEAFFLEELLDWVSGFAETEGPRLVEQGGKLAVGSTFSNTAESLSELVQGSLSPANADDLPPGMATPRVSREFQTLASSLVELVQLTSGISHDPDVGDSDDDNSNEGASSKISVAKRAAQAGRRSRSRSRRKK